MKRTRCAVSVCPSSASLFGTKRLTPTAASQRAGRVPNQSLLIEPRQDNSKRLCQPMYKVSGKACTVERKPPAIKSNPTSGCLRHLAVILPGRRTKTSTRVRTLDHRTSLGYAVPMSQARVRRPSLIAAPPSSGAVVNEQGAARRNSESPSSRWPRCAPPPPAGSATAAGQTARAAKWCRGGWNDWRRG